MQRELRATFMGVTTIALDDGHDSILIDGFFTRPWYLPVLLGTISPDASRIASCLQKANITKTLRAVFVAHSHYDHALDSPTVCAQTGAKLVGSPSTRMIAKGQDLPDDQILLVDADAQVFQFGHFRVTVLEGTHSPGDRFPGEITEPLRVPCAASQFRTGQCYTYLVEHGPRKVYVHPSANFVPGKLSGLGVSASTVFLGIGVLGNQSAEFRDEYWRHVVDAVGPGRIVPVHWDNFWVSLDGPLRALPWLFDNVSLSERFLRSNCDARGIELLVPRAWEVFDLS
jgi:L-ascorbate metabolism protein UlaG (beta-lactamase superfamily)